MGVAKAQRQATGREEPKFETRCAGLQDSAASASGSSRQEERIARLEALLALEGEVRRARSLRELIFCIANETRNCIPSGQTFVLRVKDADKMRLRIEAVSNITNVDRNAPAVRWLEEQFAKVLRDNDIPLGM